MDDGTVRIELRRRSAPNLWTVLDLADLERVQQYKWFAYCSPYTTYANGERRGEHRIRLHRLILDAPAHLRVDHIDHDGLNNRRSNLRLATAGLNGANMRNTGRGSSRFKGVRWDPRRHGWTAAIRSQRRERHLGFFVSEEEAARAYDAAALAVWGEFACLNFPQGNAA